MAAGVKSPATVYPANPSHTITKRWRLEGVIMNESTRPRGVTVYPMPESVSGPVDRYALVIRDNSEGLAARMVHTEGVSYLVTEDKPWTWDDYSEGAAVFSIFELIELATTPPLVNDAIDLADWVRTFGARLESNFHLVYRWANED